MESENLNKAELKKLYNKEYASKNKEMLKTKRYEAYHANLEQSRLKARNHQIKNKEKIKERRTIHRLKNLEVVREKDRNYKKNNTEKQTQYTQKWRKNNTEKYVESYKSYNQKNKEKSKQYCIDNKEHRKVIMKNRHKVRLKIDINYRIKCNLSRRFRKMLQDKNLKKGNSMIEFLGCSLIELKTHLESQFTEGMNWDNYGQFGWVVDHIMPCASFDLTKDEDRKKCWHYSNLQPLWWEENLKKSDKVFNKNKMTYESFRKVSTLKI